MTLPLADVAAEEAIWVMVLKSLVIFAVVFAIVPVLTVVERKVLGRFQSRYGPNRVGPFGLMQPRQHTVPVQAPIWPDEVSLQASPSFWAGTATQVLI